MHVNDNIRHLKTTWTLNYSSRRRSGRIFQPTKHFPLLKLYSSSKESRLQGNQTFLAKTSKPRPPNRKRKKKISPGDLQKVGFAATDAVPKGFSGLFLPTTPRSYLSTQQSVSLFFKLYSSSKKNPVFARNPKLFLAKPDATASEPEKEKEKYRQGFVSTDAVPKILGMRYEVMHLGFLSPH
ncbi:hypothetical protein CEXT_46571 [Caerostris extrusa]|uniref:Uncharacterized protein n=1 Tax=Caerostris extrusa TaxID=172846 RepID=A0AAV4MPG3_CAEEX|nr:hypothetical protein CEXT_46571 [Caerostris extrusa]